jgi:hypothetical protein
MAGASAGSGGACCSSSSSPRFFASSATFAASFCQRSSHSATFPPQARTYATATGNVGSRSPPAAEASVFMV